MEFWPTVWLFCFAITIHNIEEAIWLPRWSKTAGRWHHPVNPYEFRFAVTVLTLSAYVMALLCHFNVTGVVCRYLISGYALAMLLNVVFPHIIATMVMRRYAPGTATAVLLNLPATLLLLKTGFDQGMLETRIFQYAGPAVVFAILGSIPILFFIGRKISGRK